VRPGLTPVDRLGDFREAPQRRHRRSEATAPRILRTMPRVTQQQRELHVHDEQDFLAASAHAGDTSPYRRDDHWGADLAVDDETATTLTKIERAKTPEELWIAKTVLRREATVLCPHCERASRSGTTSTSSTSTIPPNRGLVAGSSSTRRWRRRGGTDRRLNQRSSAAELVDSLRRPRFFRTAAAEIVSHCSVSPDFHREVYDCAVVLPSRCRLNRFFQFW